MADPARSAKEAVVEIMSGMPEDSTFDEIVQELVFNRMVDAGSPKLTRAGGARHLRESPPPAGHS